ncbi:MAG: hypothetical protein IKU09_02875 [Firmicutes bacterium]|nr:hypothetical protein [Bacillota bacterium]
MRFKDYILLKLRAEKKMLTRYSEKVKDMAGYTLYTRMDRNKIRYRYKTDAMSEPVYIGWRKDGHLLRRLLDKENAEKMMKNLESNIALLENLLVSYYFTNELLTQNSKYEFQKSENKFKKHLLQHDTGLGFLTRTKSESIVAVRLFHFGFRFQYERGLRIRCTDGRYKTIYPDFTIFLESGRIIYIEHVGKLDDAGYRESFFQKILDYHANNLLLGRDVFITMDGPDGSIDINSIDQLLQMLSLL